MIERSEPEMIGPYADGFIASQSGRLQLEQCPYPEGSPDRHLWEKGWIRACNEEIAIGMGCEPDSEIQVEHLPTCDTIIGGGIRICNCGAIAGSMQELFPDAFPEDFEDLIKDDRERSDPISESDDESLDSIGYEGEGGD